MTMRFAPLSLALALTTLGASAAAQAPAPPAAPPPSPGPAVPAESADALAAALAPRPGGLTPADAAKQAAGSSYAVRARQAELRAASAKVDQALVNYFPRVTLIASYARLSPVSSSLGGGGALVGARADGPLTTGPCPTNPATTCVLDSSGTPVAASSSALDLPSLENQYSVTASLAVPISDYVLRISQTRASASRAAESKRLEVQAQELQAEADARVAFYNWVRAKGQAVVAGQAVAQAKAHVADAKQLRAAEVGSNADVLRLEAQVAGAQQLEAEAQAFESIAELQLRTLMHAPEGRPLEIGVDVLHETAAMPPESLADLQQEALQKRLELRALDEAQESLREVESATKAAYAPRLDAFADATLANPNPRIFPQRDQFDMTWDAGLRLTWILNDTFTTMGASAEAKARVEAVTEQKGSLRDAVRLEVAAAYFDMKKAVVSIESADRGIVSAEESLRVQRELFRAGRATAVNLVDAETELTRARLRRLDAHVGLLGARTRLEPATGRDAAARSRGAGGAPG